MSLALTSLRILATACLVAAIVFAFKAESILLNQPDKVLITLGWFFMVLFAALVGALSYLLWRGPAEAAIEKGRRWLRTFPGDTRL